MDRKCGNDLRTALFEERTKQGRYLAVCGKNGRRILAFPDGFYLSDVETRLIQYAIDAGIRIEEAYLTLAKICIDETRQVYREYGIEEELFAAYEKRVASEAAACLAERGCPGLADMPYFYGLIIGDILPLGAFDAQLVPYAMRPSLVGGRLLSRGTPVVRLHIPRGADISDGARKAAYRLAADIFGADIFLLDSWLLFPPHREMLPPTSNIRALCEEYTLISVDETRDTEGLWRVFGRRERYDDVSSLPDDTALRRAYIERIKKGLTFGSAVGVAVSGGQQTKKRENFDNLRKKAKSP